jgi:hypothetical protein
MIGLSIKSLMIGSANLFLEGKAMGYFNQTTFLIFIHLKITLMTILVMINQVKRLKVNRFIRLIGSFLKFKVESFNLVAGLSEDSQHQLCLEKEEEAIFSKMLILLFLILSKVVSKIDKLLFINIMPNKKS